MSGQVMVILAIQYAYLGMSAVSQYLYCYLKWYAEFQDLLHSRCRFTVKLLKHEFQASSFAWVLPKKLNLILFLSLVLFFLKEDPQIL